VLGNLALPAGFSLSGLAWASSWGSRSRAWTPSVWPARGPASAGTRRTVSRTAIPRPRQSCPSAPLRAGSRASGYRACQCRSPVAPSDPSSPTCHVWRLIALNPRGTVRALACCPRLRWPSQPRACFSDHGRRV